MTITITVEEQVGDRIVRASHMLTDTEIDYAMFDIVTHTVGQLRQEVSSQTTEVFKNPNA